MVTPAFYVQSWPPVQSWPTQSVLECRWRLKILYISKQAKGGITPFIRLTLARQVSLSSFLCGKCMFCSLSACLWRLFCGEMVCVNFVIRIIKTFQLVGSLFFSWGGWVYPRHLEPYVSCYFKKRGFSTVLIFLPAGFQVKARRTLVQAQASRRCPRSFAAGPLFSSHCVFYRERVFFCHAKKD